MWKLLFNILIVIGSFAVAFVPLATIGANYASKLIEDGVIATDSYWWVPIGLVTVVFIFGIGWMIMKLLSKYILK